MSDEVPKSTDGTPSVPTPQTMPTTAGILTGLATAWATVKIGGAMGLGQAESSVVAGAVVSSVTSLFHKLAQKWHWA